MKNLRYSNHWRHPYIFGVDGWSQWGLNHRHLSYLIEQMEGAYMGYRHRFIYHRKKIENLRELVSKNTFGDFLQYDFPLCDDLIVFVRLQLN